MKPTPEALAAIRKKVGDRTIVCSISGGKDSTAMALYLKELGLPYIGVYLDVGWDNTETLEYLTDYLPTVLGPIVIRAASYELDEEREEIAQRFEARLGHASPMVRSILKKGMFPSKRRRFCTQELKAFVIRDYLAEFDEPINTVGIRAEESSRRAKMEEWEFIESYDCDVWRPIIDWTFQDVVDIHQRHGVVPNPNYLAGADRVGCWPCIMSRKSEIKAIADRDPARIDLLRDLEAEVTKLAEARYAAKGETFESLGYGHPAFFQDPVPQRRPDGTFAGRPMPIDEVVLWSRTKPRNGRQFELFYQKDNPGCMRWGLCDSSGPQPQSITPPLSEPGTAPEAPEARAEEEFEEVDEAPDPFGCD